MINIFILEDDFYQRRELEMLVARICKEEKIDNRFVFTTAKPNELLEAVKEVGTHQLYFLDINISKSEMTGLDVAKEIRKLDPLGHIVFVTTYEEYLPMSYKYKVAALDFIDKNQPPKQRATRVRECIVIANQYNETPLATNYFTLKNKFTNFRIPFSEIYYFETNGINHRVNLVAKNGFYTFTANLNEIEQMDDCLFKCHRSFVCNITNIRRLEKSLNEKYAYFDNDKKCPISKLRMQELITKIDAL
jgi:two-component system response regulator AgrA